MPVFAVWKYNNLNIRALAQLLQIVYTSNQTGWGKIHLLLIEKLTKTVEVCHLIQEDFTCEWEIQFFVINAE